VYLNVDPQPGTGSLIIRRPWASIRLAFRAGHHTLPACPTSALPGTPPDVAWRRQIEIEPGVRDSKLQFQEAGIN